MNHAAKLDDAMAIEIGADALDATEETALAIRGYRDAMTYVLQLAEEPRFHFGEQLIKSLHFMMTRHDLKSRPGRWRAGPIYVQEEEIGEIVYEGVDLDQIDGLMHELVSRLENDEDIPIVVKAAMAHLNLGERGEPPGVCKKAAVDLALRRLVGTPLSREFLLGLEGIGWSGDLDELRNEAPE